VHHFGALRTKILRAVNTPDKPSQQRSVASQRSIQRNLHWLNPTTPGYSICWPGQANETDWWLNSIHWTR